LQKDEKKHSWSGTGFLIAQIAGERFSVRPSPNVKIYAEFLPPPLSFLHKSMYNTE